MITKEAIEAAAKELLAHGEFGTNDGANRRNAVVAAEAALTAALAAMPGPAVRGTVAAFEDAYPELYYHIAKGKICAGEPLYGAIITTMGTTEIGHGESDISADDAFQSAVKNSGLYIPPAPDLAAETAQCCMCGKLGLSTTEGDGGTECELTDGRWVCSWDCWAKAVDPEALTIVTDLAAENERLRKALERQGDNMAFVINHATLPEQWMTKFMAELAEDRAALERK